MLLMCKFADVRICRCFDVLSLDFGSKKFAFEFDFTDKIGEPGYPEAGF